MKSIYYAIRSIFIWIISIIHFFPVCTILVLLGKFIDPRKNDKPQRWFFRNIMRIAGAKLEVKYSPGFDRTRTSFFVCNHIDIWDAFIIYSGIPQFVRGLEHESHFKVPAYGWMMKQFGNIPVPPETNTSAYKKMMKLTKDALKHGISLIVFAEGSRTRDGRLRPFNPGVFRMAIQYGYPIVPMTITGAFEFSKKGDWKLYPSNITIYMHDTIETEHLGKGDIEPLMNKVHDVISGPIDDYYGKEIDTETQRSMKSGDTEKELV